MTKVNRFRTGAMAAVASMAAAALVVGGTAAPAQASDIDDSDNVTISPSSSSYSDQDQVDIEQDDGLEANTEYTVGICEYDTYAIPLIGTKVPACMEESQVDVFTDGNGVLSIVDYELLASGTNAHWPWVPGNPQDVDCDDHLCEIVVTPTHGGGSGGSYAGDSAEFNVS